MRLNRFLATIVTLVLLFSGCANYQLNLSEDLDQQAVSDLPVGLEPAFTLYAIGNLGLSPLASPVRLAFRQKLEQASEKSAVLFLGNQLPAGMPDELEVGHAEAKRHLDAIGEMLITYEQEVYFIAGQTDWQAGGRSSLERQKDYLEDRLQRDDLFFPDPGCGDPEEIELDDNNMLLLIDSQWWLEDWTGQPKINGDCDIKDRGVFQQHFEDAIKGNRSKNILIASHHPPFSNGYYGGQYPFKRHLFPLTFIQEGLLLPLPVLGSLVTSVRASIGGKQETSNPSYQALNNILISSTRKNGRFTFLSAHENNQQYFERDEQAFAVSGAGQPAQAARTGNGALFTQGAPGFTQVDFMEDGSVWLTFYNENGTPVFRRQAQEARKVELDFEDLPSAQALPKVKNTPVSQQDFTRNRLGRWFWGEHYRESYNAQIEVPVFSLDEYAGGVRPVKRGGGYQTNSLRLEAENGQQYTMRSIDKDPSRTVPYPFNQSFILEILRDNFSSSHPLGALPVPQLADAVGVFHTNPGVYHVPPQRALGRYNEQFGEALYLVEERPDEEVWQDQASFGYPKEIVSTSKAVEEITEEHDHVIDYRHVVRSRLFDLFLGDWDRHDDQWRWAVTEEDDLHVYRPIPRDRDQVFSNYDGFLIRFVRQLSPQIKKLRPFTGKPKQVYWTTYGSRFFDATFLSGADWSLWEEEIEHLQRGLTDERIEQAFRENWPASVYDLDAPRIIRTLKERRDRLETFARKFYQEKVKQVDVLGTQEEDYFLIERYPDESVRIKIWGAKKDGEIKEQYYERTFWAEDTKEIRVYGLDKDDHFELRGTATSRPLIRIIGGLGEDDFEDEIEDSGTRKSWIYDSRSEEYSYKRGKSTRLKFSEDPKLNTYNRQSKDYEYNFWGLLPSIGVNPDDGLLLGLSANYTYYGFQKLPYAGKQQLQGQFAFATGGFRLNYTGEWIDLIGKWEGRVDATYQTPLYTTNFYGFGNETLNQEDLEGDNFHRLRLRELETFLAFSRREQNTLFSIGPVLQSVKLEATPGRFITSFEEGVIDERVFQGLEYLGLMSTVTYANIDKGGFPTYGLRLQGTIAYLQQLQNRDVQYPYLKGAFTLYRHLDPNKQLVLATRIGGQYTFTDDYTVFQGATLGGLGPNSNFRGLRRDRYRGKAALYQNIDLRWRFNSSVNWVLPFGMGLVAGFDHGRVWQSEETSDIWHYSYGGGFFLSPFNEISLSFSLFKNDRNQTRFAFSGGFFF